MAFSGTINGTTNNKYIDCKAVWTVTQDTVENYSTVTVSLYYFRTNTGYTTEGTWNGYITINGKTVRGSAALSITNSNTLAMKASVKVPHNADGTKSATISASGSISGTTLGSTYLSGTIKLPTIPRKATITSAPDFNDEANPTIKYTNNAGASVSSLQACISLTGGIDDIVYRDISKTGTSYTFNLTDSERRVLRAATTGKSRTVKFYIKTVINGVSYYSNLSKTYSIINGNPRLAPTVVDSNESTIRLTGDSNILVKYYSRAKYQINATAKKEATIVSQKVTCGKEVKTTGSGVLLNIESGEFMFNAVDSRGYVTNKPITKKLVEYKKLTCNFTPSNATAAGDVILNISGNYFNGNFGALDNHLLVHYRYKKDDESYSDWVNAKPTITGNTYSVSISISGLDYNSKYTYQAEAQDALMVSSQTKNIDFLPVFDWGKDDFRFNVPVRLNAGGDLPHRLLWQGQNYMNASQTAYLTEKVSDQFSGIVLVFSNYDTSSGTGKVNNYDWHCFYIPKRLVELHEGTGHTFNMMSQAFGDIASKYLYISDTTITGNDVNTTNGTRNGITYNNAKYVMRYVLGV